MSDSAISVLRVLPLAISFLALGVSFAFGLFTLRDRRMTMRLSREADIKTWIGDVRNIYVDLQSEIPEVRQASLARLYILVDFGRLFFPNDAGGLRSAILDPLVASFRRCNSGDFDVALIRRDWRSFIDSLSPQTTPFIRNTSPEALGERQYRNEG